MREGRLTTWPDGFPAPIPPLVLPDNHLPSLPALPSEFWKRGRYSNLLTSLQVFPSGIQELSVSDNQLTRLPEMPSEVSKLLDYNKRQ
ncbi:E3 ubiquitin--protein ligase, partial [Salmonella enterica subsp. enterica serovar Weltevreden]|nr:E3 ubiquitin--protein ligase [Salmonella enterica subsp. enterica serovar Weltevreden]